ncbi:MAG: GntR family transcriptional regulator [Planctomycetota bacterium]|nr:GntR family transcriptional regulator [Planctomycetota bacterium]MEA3340665.1 GntR family transcriptional regulator [Chloroflexota bacterium]
MARKATATKAQQAYRKVRKLLLTGQLRSGQKTSLRALAGQLGISVVPVSEAVRRLEQEGLVQTKPQSGIYVARLTPRKQSELAVVRQALEMQAARLIAIAQPEKQLHALRVRARRIVDYQSLDKPSLASYTDWQFHVKLVAASGCRLLNERYEGITALAMIAAMNLDQSWYESDVSHFQVVKALESGDPDLAAATIQQHLGAEPLFLGAKH